MNWKVKALAIVLVFISGCSMFKSFQKKPEPLPKTPQDALTTVVLKNNWLVTVSIMAIATSVFAVLNGLKWGFAGAIAGIVSLCLSLAVIRYAQWLAIAGLTGAGLLCLASILLKNNALKDIIRGVEKIKRAPLIEREDINKILKENSPKKETRKLVDNYKIDMKLSGEI